MKLWRNMLIAMPTPCYERLVSNRTQGGGTSMTGVTAVPVLASRIVKIGGYLRITKRCNQCREKMLPIGRIEGQLFVECRGCGCREGVAL